MSTNNSNAIHASTNSAFLRKITFRFSDLPKHANPPGDALFDEAYINSSRANSIFFPDLHTFAALDNYGQIFDDPRVILGRLNRIGFSRIAHYCNLE